MRRTLISVIFIASLLSILMAINHFYIQRNYYIYAQVPCDPYTHSCFIGDGEGSTRFYKEIQKMAYAIPACDGWKEACPPLRCEPGEQLCSETYCTSGGDVACTAGIFQ
jgi:hypothetical protein